MYLGTHPEVFMGIAEFRNAEDEVDAVIRVRRAREVRSSLDGVRRKRELVLAGDGQV